MGDRLQLLSAKAVDNSLIKGINLVGYRSKNKKNLHRISDVGEIIESDKGFNRGWSKDQKGKVFAITAFSKGKIHGWINLSIDDVHLEYADILINGKSQV